MAKIRCLDEHLTNMIAAGEVVERPSGIVKELVENSIDAHAKNIEIRIVQGGIESICIIDDGEGMDEEDACNAFERHATSKLKDIDDLWNIQTMGFRGEAIPSIASVASVNIKTNNGEESCEVEVNYGQRAFVRKCACVKGTTITVRNLFQKTPARFKHLKTPPYEFSLISDVVQKFAFSHPEIAFSLYNDGRAIMKTKGNGNLREILMQVYDRESAKTAIELDNSDFDYHIGGYIMQPNVNRATKYYMLFFINGRMVRNHKLQKSIIDAFSAYLPKDRYPIAVIHITMDAQLVDVNVHPSKWEIRLSKEKQLENLLYDTIKEALRKQFEVAKVVVKEEVKIEKPVFDLYLGNEEKQVFTSINNSFNESEIVKQPSIAEIESSYEVKKVEPLKKEIYIEPIVEDNKPTVEVVEVEEETINEERCEEIEVKVVNPSLPQLEVIGQFRNNYILAQGEKGLYIIDQHAAQERYHYEIIQKEILAGHNNTQPLLIPITIDLNLRSLDKIDELNNHFKSIGITLELFGDNSVLVRELPVWMKDVNEKAFIQDMIDYFERDNHISIEKLRKKAIATMACHSSIRFHHALTMDEMKQVIIDLGKCEQPFHCPHGRPTLMCISDDDLFHQFERG